VKEIRSRNAKRGKIENRDKREYRKRAARGGKRLLKVSPGYKKRSRIRGEGRIKYAKRRAVIKREKRKKINKKTRKGPSRVEEKNRRRILGPHARTSRLGKTIDRRKLTSCQRRGKFTNGPGRDLTPQEPVKCRRE